MNARIELPEWVTFKSTERAYIRAKDAKNRWDHGFFVKGMRAARARDGRVLKTLDGMANALDHAADDQMGQTLRSSATDFAFSVPPAEVDLMREACLAADRGDPLEVFGWLYGAAAELAGY